MECSTIGSDFDTSLAIYRGDALNSLTAVASDNDSGAGGTSVLRFGAISNTVYRIAVDGPGNAMGRISLSWEYLTARLGILRTDDSTVSLTLNGADGTYNLQVSSNLTAWSTIDTITVTSGNGSSSQSYNASRRFYRAVLPEP